ALDQTYQLCITIESCLEEIRNHLNVQDRYLTTGNKQREKNP
ncbi:hypothetical protein E2320_007731, partial [Naja naja]